MKVERLKFFENIMLNSFFGKGKALVDRVVYPRELQDQIGHDAWKELDSLHHPYLKSKRDGHWYTIGDTEGNYNQIMKADAELARALEVCK
jgi:hypothetical protein